MMTKRLICFSGLFMIAVGTAGAALAQQWPPGIRQEKLFINDSVAVERFNLESTRRLGFARESLPAPLVTVEFQPVRDVSGDADWRFERARFFSKEAGVTVAQAGDGPLRVILIYLRTPPEKSPFTDDATKLDPKHNNVVFENKYVRVVRVHFGPGESGPMVDKRARVIIMLTDSHATVTLPDGHSEVRDGKAGTVAFSKGGRQATNNVGTAELENIVVELKSK
jgi:hypothetical protein